MALQDWNWRLPAELQDVPWDCAAASLTWALNTIGWGVTEDWVVQELYPTYLSPQYGLLDASGAGLVEWLATQGIAAANNPDASWAEIVAAAGSQPMIIGGRTWYHWAGVRISDVQVNPPDAYHLALANPSPGWMDVGQVLPQHDFYALGPWSAVWLNAW